MIFSYFHDAEFFKFFKKGLRTFRIRLLDVEAPILLLNFENCYKK